MDAIIRNLDNWKASLVSSIPVGGLMSRSPIAYKWKSSFRCWLVREATFWRITDLLTQSYHLHMQGHGLGARILLRSGLETLATLLYLNNKMKTVVDGKLNFQEFGDITSQLALGSKNGTSENIAINVITMIDKVEINYPGLRKIYDSLSESAHPNFDGLVWGYSKVNYEEYQTNFTNRWMDLHADGHSRLMEICIMIFFNEYDQTWPNLMEKLEKWIVDNDQMLSENSQLN